VFLSVSRTIQKVADELLC